LRRDQQTVQTAGVRGTPSMIVGGKYLVAGSEAVANYDVMLDVVNFLIEVDLAAQAVAAPASAGPSDATAEPAAED
jgi:predicted DsbA family dithiol-disulfide isomerase